MFFLCTSHQVMRQVAEVLRREIGRTVLLQGKTTSSGCSRPSWKTVGPCWWPPAVSGGIDVRGAALSCVIIDKLPFASPDDPQLKARVEDLQAQGDPFAELQLPKAVIALKQGWGGSSVIAVITAYWLFVIPGWSTSPWRHLHQEPACHSTDPGAGDPGRIFFGPRE